MAYKLIKWSIILLPVVFVGVWEVLRHTILLTYLPMDMTTLMTPFLLFFISITLLFPLFSHLERMQEELQLERTVKAKLEERERLARELHDGIAQSLFLLSVKLDKAERRSSKGENISFQDLRQTVHEVNSYVRESISNLRVPAELEPDEGGTMQHLLARMGREVQVKLEIHWAIREDQLSLKDKVELFACIREAVINVRKHSGVARAIVSGVQEPTGWSVSIEDYGKGMAGEEQDISGKYGLKMTRERAILMGWDIEVQSRPGHTEIKIQAIS